MTEVRAEFARLRRKYGAADFDRSLQTSGLTRQQYLRNLQRRMTLQKLTRQKIDLPSRLGPQALRAYYNRNLQKFQRPEQVRLRLILAAVESAQGSAKPEEDRKAKEKIDKIYQELKSGKDFAALAQQFSDDFYRMKGGDVGWMHKGSLDPDFEPLAFKIPVGQYSQPFRTQYGYNILKVEAREPSRLLRFEEVRVTLKGELEAKKFEELRQAWMAHLKKGAQIEIVEASAASAPQAQTAH